MPRPDQLTRPELADMLGLTDKQRIIQSERDLDDVDDGMDEIAKALKFQTRAIIAGLVTIIGTLLGLAVGK